MSDLINRADAIDAVKKRLYETAMNNMEDGDIYADIAEYRIDIWLSEIPSADAVSREDYHNLLTASDDIDRALREYQAKEEQPSAEATGDLISRASALEEMAMAECGCSYSICVRDNCDCSYISRIKGLPSAEPTAEEVWRVAQKVFYSTLTYREAVDYLKEVEKQHERFNQQSGCD